MRVLPLIAYPTLFALLTLTIILVVGTDDRLEKHLNNPYIIDTYMTDVTAEKIDETGTLVDILKGERFSHIPYHSSTRIVKPQYIKTTPSGSPWVLRAEKGLSVENNAMIHLSHHVIVSREKSDTNMKTILLTDNANFYPKKNIITTKAPVTAKRAGTTIHAIGMIVNTKTGIIKLLSQIRGAYETTF
jgi:LPS export ABC transporter protein LptC